MLVGKSENLCVLASRRLHFGSARPVPREAFELSSQCCRQGKLRGKEGAWTGEVPAEFVPCSLLSSLAMRW